MYAFAIMSWELLAEKKPFQVAHNEIVLSSLVHQGHRPSLTDLPVDCPKAVVDMIESCWSTNRAVRKSAIECYSLLNYYFGLQAKTAYDIYLCHAWGRFDSVTCSIFHRLTQSGMKVYFPQNEVDSIDDNVIQISNCKMFLPVIHYKFQETESFLRFLREARKIQPPRLVVPIFAEAHREEWCNQELIYLLQLRSASPTLFDVSGIVSQESPPDDDGDAEDLTDEARTQLNLVVDSIVRLLRSQTI
jgi:Protein tyrosine and serine/threonine kinase